MTQLTGNSHSDRSQFEKKASGHHAGTAAELIHFLMHNKKWWLTPIILVLVLLGALVILGGTAVGPFIYTLF